MKNNLQNENQIIRVVIDTNLWISFLIGKKLDCLPELLDNPLFELVSTPRLNEEILKVSQRPKLRKYFSEESVLLLEKWMRQHFTMVEISNIPRRCRDPKDDYLLELAVRANATYLVSGDKDLLNIGQINNCKVVTAAQFETEWK